MPDCLLQLPCLPYPPGAPLPTSGLLADKLLRRGWPVKRVRRTLQTVGMLGPAACMLAAASPLTDGNPGAASAWVTAGLGLNALTLAAVSVSHLDVAPKHAGVVFAAGNTCATLAGLLAVPLTGVVLETTQSWPLVSASSVALTRVYWQSRYRLNACCACCWSFAASCPARLCLLLGALLQPPCPPALPLWRRPSIPRQVFGITAGHYVVGAAVFATWVGDRPLPQDG